MSATDSQARLTAIRRTLAGHKVYSEAFVKARCERAYGREISEVTWWRWQQKVRATADPADLTGMSEATYLLLFTLAGLLRGNDEDSRCKQVGVSRLVYVVELILSGEKPYDLPERISYEELKHLAEVRSLRSYCDAYHRKRGLKKKQSSYSKAEATEILNKYPDYSYVYEVQQAS